MKTLRILSFLFIFNSLTLLAQEILLIKNYDVDKLYFFEQKLKLKFYYISDGEAIVGVSNPQEVDIVKNEFQAYLLGNYEKFKDAYIVFEKDKLSRHQIASASELLLEFDDFIIVKYRNERIIRDKRLLNKSTPLIEINARSILKNKLESSSGLKYEFANYQNSIINNLLSNINADSIAKTIKDLENFGTRWCLHSNRKQVALYIRKRFLNFGFSAQEARLDSFYLATYNSWQYNVVCEYKGSDMPSKYVVIGGHYDSYSNQNINVTAPGADDNASGTAAVIEIARAMKASGYVPKITIIFAAFAAEEYGLHGSYDMAVKLKNKQADVKAMINFDMIAYNNQSQNPNNFFYILPYTGADDLKDLMFYSLNTYTALRPIIGSANSSGSDSYSFYSAGYKSVFMFEYIFNPYYHSPSDLYVNCDINYATEAVKGAAAAAIFLASSPEKVAKFELLDFGDGNRLLARWRKNLNDITVKYKLRIRNVKTDNWTEYVTFDTFFVFQNLQENETYETQIAALSADGFESPYISAIQSPKSVPRMPQNFIAIPKKQSVLLRWNSNKEFDVKGYRIYKANADSDAYEVLIFNDKDYTADTFYIDSNIEPIKYYKYKIAAIDNDGNISELSGVIKTRGIFLQKKKALVINETKNGSGGLYSPTISQTDMFYSSLLNINQALGYFYDFDRIYGDSIDQLTLADLAIYEMAFYHNDENSDYRPIIKNSEKAIRDYLAEGGIFVYSGFSPSRAIQAAQGTTTTFSVGSLAYDCFGLQKSESKFNSKFIGGYKNNQVSQSFPYKIWIDSAKTSSSDSWHLKYVEAIYPKTSGAQIAYKYNTFFDTTTLAGSLKHAPVAIYTQRTLVFSFPLFYLRLEDAAEVLKNFFVDVFGTWNTNLKNEEISENPIKEFIVYQNYPNPFNASTVIEFQLPEYQKVEITIYDCIGREILNLVSDYYPAGRHKVNFRAENLSSGLYYMCAKAGDKFVTKKMILLK